MARLARIVAPGHPHHVTQRGNRRQRTFFSEDDYRRYLRLMAQWCSRWGVEIWSYCLMPNHVHLIAVPPSEAALRKAVGEAHRRYSVAVNRREGWIGHLWQGRFSSFAMDERHLLAAARYIETNPVRAGLVRTAEEYRWSSAGAHVAGTDDELAVVAPLLSLVDDWRRFLFAATPWGEEGTDLRKHERTGRPLGDETFLLKIEHAVGRRLRRRRPGPKDSRAAGDVWPGTTELGKVSP